MTPLRIASSLAVLGLLAACATEPSAPLQVTHLDGSTGMTVSGDRLQSGRVLRFGEFSASQAALVATRIPAPATCLAGCNRAIDIGIGPFRQEFERRYAAAASKSTFTQAAPGGLEAVVRTIDQVERQSSQQAALWFGIPPSAAKDGQVASRLMGSIEAPADDRPAWRFVLLQDDAPHGAGGAVGWLVDDRSRRILIKPKPLPAAVPQAATRTGGGYQFELDGRVIGSIDLLPSARVWMRDEMVPEVKLVLASVSSALLVRTRAP